MIRAEQIEAVDANDHQRKRALRLPCVGNLAAKFVANVYALPVMENDNQGGNFSFRGMTQVNNISRNYFRWFIPSDTYNVERLDFGKGSNSLIFGEVEPGGIVAAMGLLVVGVVISLLNVSKPLTNWPKIE